MCSKLKYEVPPGVAQDQGKDALRCSPIDRLVRLCLSAGWSCPRQPQRFLLVDGVQGTPSGVP